MAVDSEMKKLLFLIKNGHNVLQFSIDCCKTNVNSFLEVCKRATAESQIVNSLLFYQFGKKMTLLSFQAHGFTIHSYTNISVKLNQKCFWLNVGATKFRGESQPVKLDEHIFLQYINYQSAIQRMPITSKAIKITFKTNEPPSRKLQSSQIRTASSWSPGVKVRNERRGTPNPEYALFALRTVLWWRKEWNLAAMLEQSLPGPPRLEKTSHLFCRLCHLTNGCNFQSFQSKRSKRKAKRASFVSLVPVCLNVSLGFSYGDTISLKPFNIKSARAK